MNRIDGSLMVNPARNLTQGKYHVTSAAFWRISSESRKALIFATRSCQYCENDTPSSWQVFFKLIKVPQRDRTVSLRVLPLTLRRLAYSRISDSLRLLCKGISGRSNTNNNTRLFLSQRANVRFKVI